MSVPAGTIVRCNSSNVFVANHVQASDTDVARGLALRAAVNASAIGDIMYVGPGYYRLGVTLGTDDRIDLKASCKLIGAGMDVTFVDGVQFVGQIGTIRVRNSVVVANLTIRCLNAAANAIGLGLPVVQVTSQTGTAQFVRVKTQAHADGYQTGTGFSMRWFSCQSYSGFDCYLPVSGDNYFIDCIGWAEKGYEGAPDTALAQEAVRVSETSTNAYIFRGTYTAKRDDILGTNVAAIHADGSTGASPKAYLQGVTATLNAPAGGTQYSLNADDDGMGSDPQIFKVSGNTITGPENGDVTVAGSMPAEPTAPSLPVCPMFQSRGRFGGAPGGAPRGRGRGLR